MKIVLCVDVGNSHTVLGIYEGEKIVEHWRLTTPRIATSDEVYLRAQALINASSVTPDQITHIGLASVVPSLERVWMKALNIFLKPDVEVVNEGNCLGLEIQYDNATSLGTDRIANAVALKIEGHQTAIALDLGTATTFDILENGIFRGGVILPGISSSLEVLTQKAIRLPEISLEWPDNFVANNTEDAIRSGILFGFLGSLEYVLKGIHKELGNEDIPVIATGGWASMLGDRTAVLNKFDPFLTLKGIKAIALGTSKP
tara:strand:- start:1249 stop:2025 length:777 start_codon:yes stop_codon:yes gene_type:complete